MAKRSLYNNSNINNNNNNNNRCLLLELLGMVVTLSSILEAHRVAVLLTFSKPLSTRAFAPAIP